MPASGLPNGAPLISTRERQVDLAAVPRVAELVRRHRDRRERGRGLRLVEAETLGELGGNQVAQRPVVREHQQLDVLARLVGTRAHRHVVGDHRDLALEVDAELLARHHDVLAGAEKIVRASLVDERIGPETRRHLRAARLAHQLDVIHVRRAIDPLIRTRQRRHCAFETKRSRRDSALLERLGRVAQQRHAPRPVVERLLQRTREMRYGQRARQAAIHEDQLAVASAVAQSGEFHFSFQLST